MDEDDLEPVKRTNLEPKVFDTCSIEEIEAYIGELKAEISRSEAAIAAKKGFRSSAEDVFRR